MNIKINKKIWNTFSKVKFDEYRNMVFKHYRKVGFPYYDTTKAYRNNEFKKIKSYDTSKVYSGGVVKQTMHGLALCWSYHPHSFSVKCNGLLSPIEVFENDELFNRAIIKRTKYGDNMSDAGILKTLRMFTGAQGVSNFRPTAAKAIYDKFCMNGAVVWDMSSGYGGRLLGAILSDSVGIYIGTDPCMDTFNGLLDMTKDFGGNTKIELFNCGSESYIPEENSLDFAFTSPPYFNTEKYSDEESQSYLKYPTYDKWLNGFIGVTFANVYIGLKCNSNMAINVANTKATPTLVEDCIRLAESVGFKFIRKDKLALSTFSRTIKKSFKYEPILVFKKMPPLVS